MECSDDNNDANCTLTENCIICLENFDYNEVIHTTCCNQYICNNCYHILLKNKSVDCPNCRSYFNNTCDIYSEAYLVSKIKESITVSRSSELGFLEHLNKFEKLCQVIYDNDLLMEMAFTKYIYILKSELLFYTTNCYIVDINVPLSIVDLSYVLSKIETPVIILDLV